MSRSLAFHFALVVGLVVLALSACTSEPPPPYLGHWESTYRGRGGEANGLLIRSDSTVDRLQFRAFDFVYSVHGDSLRLSPMLPDSFLPPGDTVPPVFTSHFAIHGDTLMRSDTQLTEWLVREGRPVPGAPEIVGTWRVVRSTSRRLEHGFERFRQDSVLQVRVPVNVTTGTYRARLDPEDTTRPDSMTFYFTEDTSRCVLTWSTDTLVLTRTFTNGTFSFGYLRQGDTSWYRVMEP